MRQSAAGSEAQARAPAAVRGLYSYNLRRFSQLAENALDRTGVR
jgi:hypothetical protein